MELSPKGSAHCQTDSQSVRTGSCSSSSTAHLQNPTRLSPIHSPDLRLCPTTRVHCQAQISCQYAARYGGQCHPPSYLRLFHNNGSGKNQGFGLGCLLATPFMWHVTTEVVAGPTRHSHPHPTRRARKQKRKGNQSHICNKLGFNMNPSRT